MSRVLIVEESLCDRKAHWFSLDHGRRKLLGERFYSFILHSYRTVRVELPCSLLQREVRAALKEYESLTGLQFSLFPHPVEFNSLPNTISNNSQLKFCCKIQELVLCPKFHSGFNGSTR
jgi:hypothetical protein